MGIGIVLYFDDDSEKRICELWEKIYELDLCREMIDMDSRPHIALCCMREADNDEVIKRSVAFFKDIKPFKLRFDSYGSFPGEGGTVFLAPAPTEELLKLHKAFDAIFPDYETAKLDYYKPCKWTPHCTLALRTAKECAIRIMELLMDDFEPLEVEVTRVGFAEIFPIRYMHDKTIRLTE